MAVSTLLRSILISNSLSPSLLKRVVPTSPHPFNPSSPPPLFTTSFSLSIPPFAKSFCTTRAAADSADASESPPTVDSAAPASKRRTTLVNFSLSDSDSDSDEKPAPAERRGVDKSKLPPPYDPFNKKPAVEEPEDPTNLQEVFQKIRSDGLMNSAVKMFDGLSKEGLTHEALELFSQIKDKGEMPDVVAHTAVVEAYANAGQAKEALKVFMRMLASGVLPNAYSYGVLIKGLVESGDERMVKEARKHLVEMTEKRGIRPNAAVCVGVYQGLVKAGLEEEGKQVVEMLKRKGVVPEEEKVREALKDKRGPLYRAVVSAFYGK